jgi:phosphatidylglycerophosphate synthase
MSVIVMHEGTGGNLRVAGLSVLERLVVAAHRAGGRPITVVATAPLTGLRWLAARGIEILERAEAGLLSEPTLVLRSDALIQSADLRRVIERGGRLVTRAGERLPVGVLEGGRHPGKDAFDGLPAVCAEEVAMLVRDEPTRRAAERALWKSLRSASDGQVDVYFNRPAGRLLSKLLIHTPMTPNQVSICSILIGIWSGWWFAKGDPIAAVIGAIVLQISAIIDCVDGDLARILLRESALGKWLDLAGDQLVHLAVFIGIPLGLSRQGLEAPWLFLGASAGLGTLLSFWVVARGLLNPALRGNARLQRLIDATTNRDFSVLVFLLAVVGALEWFVWLAAVGVHVFWITVRLLQRSSRADNPKPGGAVA